MLEYKYKTTRRIIKVLHAPIRMISIVRASITHVLGSRQEITFHTDNKEPPLTLHLH